MKNPRALLICNRTLTVVLPALVSVFVSMQQADAQNITVQQPVISNFSVGTSVSVPDRGGAYLGGVGRAASSRISFGFGPFGRNNGFGRELSHSGASAHVWIHDFAEMDRLILEGVREQRPNGGRLHGAAGHAYMSFYDNTESGQPTSALAADQPAPAPLDTRKASAYYQLGLKAKSRGSRKAARLHFEKAAEYGSTDAARELAAMRTVQSSAP